VNGDSIGATIYRDNRPVSLEFPNGVNITLKDPDKWSWADWIRDTSGAPVVLTDTPASGTSQFVAYTMQNGLISIQEEIGALFPGELLTWSFDADGQRRFSGAVAEASLSADSSQIESVLVSRMDGVNLSISLEQRPTGDTILVRDIGGQRHELATCSAPSNIAVVRPVPIVTESFGTLQGFLFESKEQRSPAPLVISFHGGPRENVSATVPSPEDEYFLEKGFSVLSINYPGSTTGGRAFRQAGSFKAADVGREVIAAAVAAGKGLREGSKLILVGGSYGAYVSALTSNQFREFQAVILMSGTYNPALLYRRDRYGREFNTFFTDGENILDATSRLVENVDDGPPIIIVHGGRDDVVPPGDAEAFGRRASDLGWRVEYILLPEEGHRTAIDAAASDRIMSTVALGN